MRRARVKDIIYVGNNGRAVETKIGKGGSKKMTEAEIITTQIGEFVSVEMDGVERVDYTLINRDRRQRHSPFCEYDPIQTGKI